MSTEHKGLYAAVLTAFLFTIEPAAVHAEFPVRLVADIRQSVSELPSSRLIRVSLGS